MNVCMYVCMYYTYVFIIGKTFIHTAKIEITIKT